MWLLSIFLFFFPSSRIFEHIKYIKNLESQKNIRSYNTVFETSSNHSFQVPSRSYKVKHAKRFVNHGNTTRPLKSIERRSSLPAITLLKTTHLKIAIEVKSVKNTSEGILNASSKMNYVEGSFLRILPKNKSAPIFQNTSRWLLVYFENH